jgi:enoyl-CoA hydratase
VRWTKRALNGWVRQQAPLFEHSVALEMLTTYGSDMRDAMKAIHAGQKPEFSTVQP